MAAGVRRFPVSIREERMKQPRQGLADCGRNHCKRQRHLIKARTDDGRKRAKERGVRH